MLKVSWLLLAWAVPVALGCDYDNDGPPEPDATVPNAGASDGSVVLASDASQPARPLDGGALPSGLDGQVRTASEDGALPFHESFETALPVDPGVGVLVDIVHSAQSNFFAFEAAAPGFYEIRTNNGDFSPDVVLSLYDGTRSLLARNDSGSLWPGDAVDARLVVHLNAAGSYFVKVDDPSTPADFFTRSSNAVRFYRLDVRALSADSDGVAIQTGAAGAPIRFVQDLDSEYAYVTVVGTMLPSAVARVALTGMPNQALIGHVLAAGSAGNGSTASAGPVGVLRVSDGQLLAEVDGSADHLQLFPPISEGSYELTVGAPAALGDNAFYAIDLVMLPDNPREQNDPGNNTLVGAEPIQFEGTSQRRGLLLCDVAGSDVDYYSFAATGGATILVSCEGQSAGSGVREVQLELRDAADKLLASAVESSTHALDVSGFVLPADGNYYLRLASQHTPLPGDAEPWLRCVVFVQT